jgi:hypothetical protein
MHQLQEYRPCNRSAEDQSKLARSHSPAYSLCLAQSHVTLTRRNSSNISTRMQPHFKEDIAYGRLQIAKAAQSKKRIQMLF